MSAMEWADSAREARRLGRLFASVPRIPATAKLAERRLLMSLLLQPAHEQFDDVDFDEALALSERHAIAAMIAEHARATTPALPASFVEALEERHVHALMQNRLMQREAAVIAQALRAENIEHVFLKGTALRVRFPALAARHTDDIDLLIHEQDLQRTEVVLHHIGFRSSEALMRIRHPLIAISDAGTMCEVHIALEAGLDAQTWARRELVEVDGVPLSVPHEHDLLAHLCHHVLVQHAGVPRYLPRHLIDMAAVIDARGSALPMQVPGVRESAELVELVRAWSKSKRRATLLAAMVFPMHHSALHLAISRGLQRGFRGFGAELRSLARATSYVMYRAD